MRIRLAYLVIAAMLGAGAPARAQEQALVSLVLPSRNPAAGAIRERLARVATRVARDLDLQIATSPAAGDALTERLERARKLAVSGSLDGAARLLDETLAEGARAPERVGDAGAFITGHIRRASIAVARAELQTARILLARLYRYDPTLELAPLETTPQLAAVFADVRAQLGPAPAIEPADVGEMCNHKIVLVARPRSVATFGVTCFDDCRPVSEVTVSTSDSDESIAHELAKISLVVSHAPSVDRRSGRAKKIAGPILLAAGAVLAAAGSYFAYHAAWRLDHVGDGCTVAMPCTGTTVPDRSDDYRSSTEAASVLLPLGAAAILTGALLTALGVREGRRASLAFSPTDITLRYHF